MLNYRGTHYVHFLFFDMYLRDIVSASCYYCPAIPSPARGQLTPQCHPRIQPTQKRTICLWLGRWRIRTRDCCCPTNEPQEFIQWRILVTFCEGNILPPFWFNFLIFWDNVPSNDDIRLSFSYLLFPCSSPTSLDLSGLREEWVTLHWITMPGSVLLAKVALGKRRNSFKKKCRVCICTVVEF